jgi:hypothetical protein
LSQHTMRTRAIDAFVVTAATAAFESVNTRAAARLVAPCSSVGTGNRRWSMVYYMRCTKLQRQRKSLKPGQRKNIMTG